MSRARILFADDHRIIAEGLKLLLEDDYDVVGIVEDGQTLLEAVAELVPDLVVADVTMPKLNGLQCVQELQAQWPAVKVLLLTMHVDASLAATALRAGASGYLLKSGGVADVAHAIQLALDGETYVSPQLAGEVAQALGAHQEDAQELTPRQIEVVRLLAEGLYAKEIAQRLGLSRRTVEFHKYQAMERSGARSTAELLDFAHKRGFLGA